MVLVREIGSRNRLPGRQCVTIVIHSVFDHPQFFERVFGRIGAIIYAMDCQKFLHDAGQGVKPLTNCAFFGDDRTDLDTTWVIVISKRSLDVRFVIGFLHEAGDGLFDYCIVLRFVRELKVLYKVHMLESKNGCWERDVRSIFLGHGL